MDLRTLELKISRSENLPVLPEVISAVFRTADNSSSTPRDLEKLILCDPALTAKVIRVANSPLYGTSQVPTIARALTILGMSKARHLLISLVLQQLVIARQQSRRFHQREYWDHSLAVGTSARIIAAYNYPFLADQLYCAGVMHDIGILVMDKFCPELLDAVIGYAETSGRSLDTVEPNVLSFGHADVGRILAKHWGMDEMTINAIGFHHAPESAGRFSAEAKVIYVANILAHETGCTNQVPGCTTYQLTDDLLESVGVPPDKTEELKTQICNELVEVKRSFGALAA